MSGAAVVARRSKPQNRVKPSADAYVARMTADVNTALSWCSSHGMKLAINEFGARSDGDDVIAWQRWAEALYSLLVGSAVDTVVTAWVASENFPTHRLALYRGANQTTGVAVQPLSVRSATGRVLEQHKGTNRGINLGNSGEAGMYASGAVGTIQGFSNARELAGYTFGTGGTLDSQFNPDTYGSGLYTKQWNYGSSASWAYLASRGVTLVRLPFRWERVQRTLGGALDTTELGRIDTALGYAAANGIGVILDLHNGGGTYALDDGTQGVERQIGGATVTDTHFADVWTRLVGHFDSNATVVAYELLNEPKAVTTWASSTAQAGLTAVRSAGSTKDIYVAFPGWSTVGDIPASPFVTDPLGASHYRMVLHYYGDYMTSQSSQFGGSYAEELAAAKTAGFTGTDTSPTPATGATCVDTFTRPNTDISKNGLGSTEDANPAAWIVPATAHPYDWSIVNGRAMKPGTSTGGDGGSLGRTWVLWKSADTTVDIDLAVGSQNGPGLWMRGAADGRSALITNYTTLYAYTSPSTFTSLGTFSSAFAAGDHMQVILSGTSITVKRTRSGTTTTVGTFTSTFNQTATRFGLSKFNGDPDNTTCAWDNFSLS